MFRSALSHRRRQAFTLIEILVVVAIIALLIAILLPSLARAREQGRSSQCLSNLKQMATGTMMYATENRGFLFGPAHLVVFLNTSEWEKDYLANPTTPTDSAKQKLYYAKSNMGYAIARYLGDRRAKNLDKVAECPSQARIPSKDCTGQPWYYSLKGHYMLNTGANGTYERTKTDPLVKSGKPVPKSYGRWASKAEGKPYYPTRVPNYFGYTTLLGASGYEQLEKNIHPYGLPKQIDKINLGSREWMVADLWYWEAASAGGRGSSHAVGTWPFTLSSGTDTPTITNNGLKCASYPFHLTLSTYQPDALAAVGADRTTSSPRMTTGRTNAAYFDGHSASQVGWAGSANPCWGTSATTAPTNGECLDQAP